MTAKRILFTEMALDRIATEGTYWDTHTRAFGCRVGKTKKTLFIVRADGSREIVGHVGQIDLKTARKRAQALLLHAPEPTSSLTFQEAFELYKTTRLQNYRERSRAETVRLIEKHLASRFPSKIADTNHHHITTILAPLKPSEANHLFGALRTFFNWAEKRDLCTSPIRKLDKPFKEKSRDRILTDDELRAVWSATSSLSTFHSIVRLLILTGQRRGEVAAIRADWISEGWLHFPATITKNGHAHSNPFSPLCTSLSKNLSAGYNAWSQPLQRLKIRSGTTNWTLHDLRRTWASLAARWGIPEHLAARIQNHKTAQHLNPIRAVYQRYEFKKEIGEAMELFERNLLQLLASPPTSPKPL